MSNSGRAAGGRSILRLVNIKPRLTNILSLTGSCSRFHPENCLKKDKWQRSRATQRVLCVTKVPFCTGRRDGASQPCKPVAERGVRSHRLETFRRVNNAKTTSSCGELQGNVRLMQHARGPLVHQHIVPPGAYTSHSPCTLQLGAYAHILSAGLSPGHPFRRPRNRRARFLR